MHLAYLGRGQRKHFAQPQMIVVRADNDVFVGLARPITHHIVGVADHALNVGVQVNAQRAGESEGARLQIGIDAFDNFLQGPAGFGEPGIGERRLQLEVRNARVFRARHPAEALQVIRLGRIGDRVVDQNQSAGPMLLRIDHFRFKGSMAGGGGALPLTAAVFFLRFTAQNEHDLILHVQAIVVVVTIFGGGDAIAREHHFAGNATAAGKIERRIVLFQFEVLMFPFQRHGELVLAAELGRGVDLVTLQIAFVGSSRHQSELVKVAGDVLRRLADLGRTRAAALQLRRGEILNVFQIVLGVNQVVGRQ